MLLPTHALGLCNAWLGVLALGLLGQALVRLSPAGARLADARWYGDAELRWARQAGGINLGLLFYSVFVPLHPQGVLFVPGVLLFAGGALGALWASSSFARAAAGAPATRGLYRVSRHPIYVFTWLALLGVCAAAASWLLLLGALLWWLPMHQLVRAEERHCVQQLGAAYLQHLRRVPRYLPLLPRA